MALMVVFALREGAVPVFRLAVVELVCRNFSLAFRFHFSLYLELSLRWLLCFQIS